MNPAAPEKVLHKKMLSKKASRFTESVIREMTRLAMKHKAINLAQGFPDFPAPAAIKQAAQDAIAADINQYAITWGAKPLRDAIAEKFQRTQGLAVDPEREITVCCGSTEAMISAMMAIINPGDEVVIFEPFYENYGPDAILSGATPRFVPLRPPDFTFDREQLAAAFGPATKAIILNTPNNPTGKVFSREELEFIRELCIRWNAFAITDEIYEHILYDGARHISLATLDAMRERTITINGMSKTYSVTGWRVGWCIAPPEVTGAIRKVHDFLTVGAAAPLQQAGAIALHLPQSYYEKLATDYAVRRDRTMAMLEAASFRCFKPRGAYYIMTDISGFGFSDDVAFTRHLIEHVGVAPVPGSSFYSNPADGSQQVRFCFCKTDATLSAAESRLKIFAIRRGHLQVAIFHSNFVFRFSSVLQFRACCQGDDSMAMQFDLVPMGSRVEENGDGAKVDVNASATRTFLCTMFISDQVEQESLDVSIFGSADGDTWPAKPLLKLPQRFYRGETRAVLELALRPEVKFIRAHWDLNRWGRVAPEKMFAFGLRLAEVPAMPRRAPAEKVTTG